MAQLFTQLQVDDAARSGVRNVLQYIRIPDDYLVLDVELLGFGKEAPIVQVGWGVVRNRQLVDVASLLLNWLLPEYGQHPQWVRCQNEQIKKEMSERFPRR